MMKIESIMTRIMSHYTGISKNKNWGERGLFYNPNNQLPLGAYMLTFKEKDGANDSASHISRRPGTFRLNLKISKATFIELFNEVPKRPAAGCVIATGHDFTQLDTLMPHPVYGWMTWICVLNPSEATIKKMENLHLFDEAYAAAVQTFNKKTGIKTPVSSFFPAAPTQSDIPVTGKRKRQERSDREPVVEASEQTTIGQTTLS